jgi:hypothetical protein
MHTTRIVRHQTTAEMTGCRSGHAASGGVPVGLPNSQRTAAAIELTGFQEANRRRTGEKPPIGTNVLATKVIGKTTMKTTPCAASGALRGARMGPNSLRHVEQSMAAVAHAPLAVPGKVALCAVIDDFVFGYVARNIDPPPLDPRVVNELVGAHLASGQFPHIAALVGAEKPAAAFARAASWMRDDDRFEFGLQAILDAVAAGRVPVRGGGARR